MANDHFYGYKRDPKKVKTLTGARGSVDLDFESINPYEFKKGMDYELSKAGVPSLREASEEAREKATENVIKNLKDTHGAYYSYLEHYETTTRNMEKKPSFNTFLKEIEGYSMKEIKDNFDNDKMKEIKLKESIRAEVKELIRELFFKENSREVKLTNDHKAEMLKIAKDLNEAQRLFRTKEEYLDEKWYDVLKSYVKKLIKTGELATWDDYYPILDGLVELANNIVDARGGDRIKKGLFDRTSKEEKVLNAIIAYVQELDKKGELNSTFDIKRVKIRIEDDIETIMGGTFSPRKSTK